ncbi:MAG TPA: TetR/AcrR family transcriptional regulator [Pseudonocardia sp.]
MAAAAHASKRMTLMHESARLFRHRSYHATSMSDIAEAMQLNKGTLYYYYSSKSDILYAIYLEAYSRLDHNIAQIPQSLPADEELSAYIKAILRTVASAPDVIAVYFQEHPWLETSLTPEQARTVREKEKAFTGQLEEIVRAGVRSGVFRRVSDRLLAVQLLAMISSLYRWHLAENEASAELIADTVLAYIYEGVLTPKR